jgi:hypothetical protein
MAKKFACILGPISGSLTLLPYIFTISMCIHTLILPDSEVHFESKGYAFAFLLLAIIPALIALFGFIGSIFVRSKPAFSGIAMISAGMFLAFTQMPLATLELIIPYSTATQYILNIPPVLLILAGVFSLNLQSSSNSRSESQSGEQDSTSQ